MLPFATDKSLLDLTEYADYKIVFPVVFVTHNFVKCTANAIGDLSKCSAFEFFQKIPHMNWVDSEITFASVK